MGQGEGFGRWPYRKDEEEEETIRLEGLKAVGWDPNDAGSREEHRQRTEVKAPWRKGTKEFRGFAQRIRYMTNEGQVLIDAIFELFQRAREERKDGLMVECATWLADRGFGKPVQVGQLLDGEGNAVAFTLWAPAKPEVANDVITMTREEGVPSGPGEDMAHYLPPAEAMSNPPVKDIEKKDGYAYGPARAWGVGEAEPGAPQGRGE